MRKVAFRIVFLFAVVLLFGGCWGRKFFHMPSQTLDTSRKVDSLLVDSARLMERLESIEQRLKAQEDLSRSTKAQLKLDIESIKDEINALKETVRERSTSRAFMKPGPTPPAGGGVSGGGGKTEDSTRVLPRSGGGSPSAVSGRPDSSGIWKGSVGRGGGVRTADKQHPDTTAGPAGRTIPPAVQLYRQAYLYFNRGDYDLALEELNILVENYSQDPLCEDALFLKGESYFQRKSFFEAINQFSTLLKRFPGGKRVPGALLRMALAYEKVGEIDLASRVAKRLIAEYPFSEEAAVAKEHFKGLE